MPKTAITVAEAREKVTIIEAAAAAKRAKFKMEFMVLMLKTGRETEAASAFNDALDAVKEIIKLEGNNE